MFKLADLVAPNASLYAMVFDGELQYHNHIWTIEIYYKSVMNFEMIQRITILYSPIDLCKIIHATFN